MVSLEKDWIDDLLLNPIIRGNKVEITGNYIGHSKKDLGKIGRVTKMYENLYCIAIYEILLEDNTKVRKPQNHVKKCENQDR